MSNYDLSKMEQAMAVTEDLSFDISQTDALILKLFAAIAEYHVGANTLHTFAETYDRDEQLLALTRKYFHERRLSAPKEEFNHGAKTYSSRS